MRFIDPPFSRWRVPDARASDEPAKGSALDLPLAAPMARCQSLFHPTAQACAVGYKNLVGSRIAVQRRGGELVNVPGRSDGWSMRCGGGLGCRAGRHRIVRARWAAPWVLASESPLGRPNDDFR